MLLFILTALLVAVVLGLKLTKDVFPKPLKQWLCKLAISNWMKSQKQKFGKEAALEPKTYAEVGTFADDQEISVERPLQTIIPMLRDEYIIYGTDEKGNGVSVKLTRFPNNRTQADVLVILQDASYLVSYEGETPSAYEFSLGNLKMEMVEPFRTWRLWYNGIMTCSSSKQNNMDEKLVHVVFNFLWKALESPMDNRKNGNANLLANHLCGSGLFGDKLPSLLKIVPEGYSQFGTLHGNVNIHENGDEDDVQQQLYLYGYRTRDAISSIGLNMLDAFPVPGSVHKATRENDDARRLELFAICDNGNGFRLIGFNDDWTDGRMLWASYEVSLIKHIDCPASQIQRDAFLPKLLNIYDTKGTHRVEIWPAVKTLQLSKNAQITCLKLTINGRNGNGILIRKSDVVKTFENNMSPDGTLTVSQIHTEQRFNPLSSGRLEIMKDERKCYDDADGQSNYFLQFSHPDCLKVPLVGGKGASLAKLQTFVEKQPNSLKMATVTRGFCITTTLFRELLDLEKFAHIFRICAFNATASGNDQHLEDACKEVMEMIKSCDAAKQRISALIPSWIERIFGKENGNRIRFAVRSSGVLEDGSDLSCAGQNETFLGVTQTQIAKKVLECWASLFTEQSVRYRLNHGQPALSEMGVVIQEMVDATAAGVIFTADPRTGNPFQMIITANYGLGESVVSGSCDPDTITLVRHSSGRKADHQKNNGEKCVDKFHNRCAFTQTDKWWKNVTIGRKVMGEKRTKIVCSPEGGEEDGRNSTTEISMADQESRQFCLDEETVIKLGSVAAEIELFMTQHKPVDIEWAIDQKGQIFILQCRNLTALDAWTDFEILHELDASMRTRTDRFTTANSGEVLPKAVHAITQTMNRYLDLICQKQIYIRKGDPAPGMSPYFANTCPLFQQRLFINMYQTLYASVDAEISTAAVCVDQTVFGRQVIDEEIRKTAEERFGISSGLSKLKDFIVQIKMFRVFKSLTEREEQKYKNFKLDYACLPRRPLDVYRQMTEDLIHIYNTGITHLIVTQSSSGSQIFLFMFLSEGKSPSEWDSSLFEDASKLLSVFANVESADMPEDMNQLGNQIVMHGENIEEFLQAPSEKALEWLKGNDKVSQALDVFFEKHGHRGVAEMDLGEPSWQSDPISFLPILRNTVKNKINHAENTKSKIKSSFKNDDELLDSLSSNLKPMTRRLLKFILPTCRNAVMCREKSKSLFVRVIDQFKQKYHYLAELMVQENLLPHASLIVHLTHYEIGRLVNKDVSSSVILQKALRRQKMYPQMEKLEFPEICIGIPQSLDTSIPVTTTDMIQATPVSRGIARGVAKVCLSVEEASENIRPGDILITRGTDIAWSPFFPLLGGVVTELGGLISHGAVVAREYGLPCIVGAINATKIFKTGDQVILDAGKGTLAKVKAE